MGTYVVTRGKGTGCAVATRGLPVTVLLPKGI